MTNNEKTIRDTLELINGSAGKKNYSVMAGAGGGKTTLLSKRIARQIAGGTPIEEFVIITYTNAAAAELRDKITTQLQKMQKDPAMDASKKQNVESALNRIELMQISTIHAFLLKMLKENAFESGIALDVRMLEAEQDYERQMEFFDRWLKDHPKELDSFRPDWKKETQKGRMHDYTEEVFRGLFSSIANVREEIVYDLKDHTKDYEAAAKKHVTRWIPLWTKFTTEYDLKLPMKPPKKKDAAPEPYKVKTDIQEAVGSIKTVANNFKNHPADMDWIGNAVKLAGAMDVIVTKQKKREKEILKLIASGVKAPASEELSENFYRKGSPDQDVVDQIPNVPNNELEWNFKALYEKYMLPSAAASRAADYVLKMKKEYQKKTDAETECISNDDILYRSEKLLKDHPDILDRVRAKYTKIYVDEFQDTTGQQTRIIKMLSEKMGTKPDKDLMKADQLEQDRLIVVGDPKQSIYRFTGAEKEVYDYVYDAMQRGNQANAEAVSLDTNFRSNEDIVSWVNDSFGTLLGKFYSPMDTDWTVAEKNALHGVYRYEPGPEGYDRSKDVDAVADIVKRLVGNDAYFIEELDRDSGTRTLRQIRYSDIMIICRNTNNMLEYVEKFAGEGIPLNVEGKFHIDEDLVLRNYVRLLAYFAEPKNKKNRIIAAQIYGGFDVSAEDNSVLEASLDAIKELRKKFDKEKYGTAAIAEYLMEHEDLFLSKGKEYQAEEIRTYRIRLHQMVENCLSRNEGDMAELVRLMDDYRLTEVNREIPLESNENAVKLMNVHKSKGLTGQIVILADRGTEEGSRYGGYKKDGKYYPAASYKYTDKGAASNFPTYGWDQKRMEECMKEDMEEAMRLQYVAATRAAHALIVMPALTSSDRIWFTDPAYRLDTLRDFKNWMEERENDATKFPVQSTGSGRSHKQINREELKEHLAAADPEDMTASALISITPSGLERSGVTGFESEDAGYLKETRPGGNIFGTAMHRVYEFLIMRYDSISQMDEAGRKKAIERAVCQAILEQTAEMKQDDDPAEFKRYLMEVMDRYFDPVIAPIMEEAEEAYPEYTFSFYVSEQERKAFCDRFDRYLPKEDLSDPSKTIWVNGQADLVIRMKNGSLKVYDYKSDARNGKSLPDFDASCAEKYDGQLKLYQYAIGKAFGVPEVETELIHLYR